MKKFVEYMAVFEFIAVVAGIICFFTGHETITLFCAAFSLLHSFLNVVFGDQNGLGTEILTMLIGVIVAVVFKLDMLSVVAVAVCIGSVAFLLVPFLLVAIFGAKK
jgi:hypothetical protein